MSFDRAFNIRLSYLQYLFKCAQSSALLCLRSYVGSPDVWALMSALLMSALLCRRSIVGRSFDGSPSGGMNKSIPSDEIHQYRVGLSPLKLKLDTKPKMLMLNIRSVNL